MEGVVHRLVVAEKHVVLTGKGIIYVVRVPSLRLNSRWSYLKPWLQLLDWDLVLLLIQGLKLLQSMVMSLPRMMLLPGHKVFVDIHSMPKSRLLRCLSAGSLWPVDEEVRTSSSTTYK